MNTDIAPKTHAVLGPSGWDRWSTCPGSVVLEEGRENRTSSYAAWGTAAHEIAAKCLIDNCDPESFEGLTFNVEGHEIDVDMEMCDTVSTYIEVVNLFINREAGDVLMVEQEVPIGHLTGETGATGTSDAIGIVDGGRKLVVIDLKGGRGVTVGAFENGQGRMYALGAYEKFKLVYEDIEEVEIVISQPRVSEEPDTETLTIAELLAHADEVTQAAGRVEMAKTVSEHDMLDQYLNPSEKACKFCRAAAICPAAYGEMRRGMALVAPTSATDFEDLTLPKQASAIVVDSETPTEKLAEAMRAAPLIEIVIKAIRAEVERRLLAAQEVPGFYLGVGKAGRRAWADQDKAEAELKKRLKVDQAFNKKLISPTQAEKLFKDQPKVWAKIVQSAGINKPPGGPSVCADGAKNAPYLIGAAPDDFEDLTALPAEPKVEPPGAAGGSDAAALLDD